MGLEGAAPPEQAAVEQESKLPAADAADAAAGAELSDTLMLDAQIAEGMNNIDVIRYLKHCYVGPLGPRLCYNPTAVHAPVPMLWGGPPPAGFAGSLSATSLTLAILRAWTPCVQVGLLMYQAIAYSSRAAALPHSCRGLCSGLGLQNLAGEVPSSSPVVEAHCEIVLPFFGQSAEYANGSQVFLDKISSLQGTYSNMRRTRGDGNCFFRSFIYRYLEWLLLQQQEEECQR
jgi:hypothetical protein